MRLTRSIQLPVSADDAFAWHERPGAFERLAPPWERVRVVRHTGDGIRNGARVELQIGVGPLHTRWTVEHRDYVAGRQFRDVQLIGPFATWSHLHRIEPAGAARCVLTDDVEYTLPFGPLGALVGGSFVRAQLDRLFAYRHAMTVADLERHRLTPTPLTIAITGATGMIGRALSAFLTTGGHTVRRITRRPSAPDDVAWDPRAGTIDPHALDGVHAVVHLAGESVAERWNESHKAEIRRSREEGTRLIAETIARAERPPRVLVSASAIGYYGDRGDEVLDEASALGQGFLADVCRVWEANTEPAERADVRVVHTRFGLILSPGGGLLEKLLIPFRLGAGGRIGDGRAWMSVVALDDVIGAIHFAIATDALRGTVNVVGPAPVTNADFSDTLGHVIHRPTVAVVPEFAVKLLLGAQQAEEMALASQRVVPTALLAAGFQFRHPTAEAALRFELGKERDSAQS